MVLMTIVSQVVTMVVAVVNVTYSVLRICRQDRTRFSRCSSALCQPGWRGFLQSSPPFPFPPEYWWWCWQEEFQTTLLLNIASVTRTDSPGIFPTVALPPSPALRWWRLILNIKSCWYLSVLNWTWLCWGSSWEGNRAQEVPQADPSISAPPVFFYWWGGDWQISFLCSLIFVMEHKQLGT